MHQEKIESPVTAIKEKVPFYKYEVYGMPLYFAATLLAIIYTFILLEWLPDNLFGTVTLLFAVGFVFGEIGDRLPIWKEYIGGGAVLAFLGSAALVYFNILPEKYSVAATFFYDDYGYQVLFISLLIVSAVLSVNRKQLIKAFVGYIPAILGGIAGAALLGILGGLIFGIPIKELLSLYVLPIMGGGNGAGAIPLSEMYEKITGGSKETYYSSAFAILNVANNFAIIAAVLLHKLGMSKKHLTGNGELLRNADASLKNTSEDKEVKVTQKEMAVGLLMTGAIYAVSYALGEFVLPSIGYVTIHFYAYMVVITAIINITNVIPDRYKVGTKQLSNFLSKHLMWLTMAGIGIAFTDLGEFIAVLNIPTLVICALIVTGSVLGSGLVGYFAGFYPIEAAMSAGLCMANRGGSGDLQVLGAGHRMELMSYAAISSRIGGGIILIVASIVFSIFM
jgi:Na+/citrate or Na+/malate symporter